MIFKNITVKGFRAIAQQKTIDFSSGLNIIKGEDNEAGKSSLRMAITKALFQDPTTSREDVRALTSWGIDDPWEIDIEFQEGLKFYRLHKSLKDRSCELVCTSDSPRQRITDKNAVTSKIADFTGCPSEIFFESTACIGQDELIRIFPTDLTPSQKLSAEGDITQRLQSILSGSEKVNAPTIISKLKKKTHRKDGMGPYTQLEAINSKLDVLQTERSSLMGQVDTLMEKRKDLEVVKNGLKNLNKDLPPKLEVLEKNIKIIDLEKEKERLKSQFEVFKRAKELKSTLGNLDKDLEKFSAFSQADSKAEQIKSSQTDLQDMAKRRSELEKDSEIIRAQKPAIKLIILGLVLIVIGLAGMVVSAYSGVFAILGLLPLAYWMASYTSWNKNAKSISDKTADLDNQISAKQQVQRDLLGSLGFQSYDQFLSQLEGYLSKMEERRQISDQIKGILADKDWIEFESDNSDLDIQMSAIQKEIGNLSQFRLNPLDLQKLVGDVTDLQGKQKTFEKDKGALEGFLDYTNADTDRLMDIDDQIKSLDQKKEYWEKKKRIFDLTREVLEEAHKQTLSDAAVVLAEELGKYMIHYY